MPGTRVHAALLLALSAGLVISACASVQRRPAEVGVHYRRQIYDILIERRGDSAVATRGTRRAPETRPESLGRCLGVEGTARIYALGSSTMASLLGPALARMLRQDDVEFHKWGKSSSGLARPDFHDWPAEVPGIVRKYHPHVFVVSLGTNDFQPLRLRSRSWIRVGTQRWRDVYAQRVDDMLALMSGPDRKTAVVWIGPTAFPRENSLRIGPVISAILHERIDAFAGPATYIDVFAATTDDQNRPLSRTRVPGTGRTIDVRGGDNIHLTIEAVRALMARPAADWVRDCIGSPGSGASRASP